MRRLGAALAVVLGAGCTVGPKYQRPEAPVTPTYRGAEGGAESLGDAAWWTVFDDPQLTELVRTALKDNLDVQRAARRVEQAAALAGQARAEQLPSISASGGVSRQRSASTPFFPGFETNMSQLGTSAAWQLDFWGRYRRLNEAARATLAASEWGRKAVVASLVSNLATAWFQLKEQDEELAIAKRALAARRESLELTRTLEKGGAVSMLEVRQAEKLVELAGRRVPDVERRIETLENLISVLAGRNPGPVERSGSKEWTRAAVPAGLPSALLERRPDIKAAELQLVAANAQVGAARALYFPQVSLTGSAGFQAYSIGGLFDSKVYGVGSSVTAPVFDFGRIRSGVRLSEAQKEEMILAYKKAIQQGFQDVADALAAVRRSGEARERQQALERVSKEAAELAGTRYRGGASSYLEVLTSETDRLEAELGLAAARLDERLSVVQLYLALGGGWQK